MGITSIQRDKSVYDFPTYRILIMKENIIATSTNPNGVFHS